jgi:hypothetical protein
VSNYNRGRRLEYRVMRELRAHDGTAHVMRSAGSHGAADIVALSGGRERHPEVLLIQCKTYGIPSYDERVTLGRLSRETQASAVVAWQDDGQVRYSLLRYDGSALTKRGVDLDRVLLDVCWGASG